MLIGALLGVVNVVFAGQPTDELAAALAQFRSTALEAVYVPDSGFAEVRVGFDPATGAWYRADQQGIIGRDTLGTYFGGESGLGRSKVLEVTSDSQPAYIGEFCPPAMVWQMLRDPTFVLAAERVDNLWKIDVQYPDIPGPGGAPIHRPPIHIEYDQAAGQITRMYRDDRLDYQSRFEYADAEAARVHMPSRLLLPGFHLVGLMEVKNTREGFSRDRVESLGAQAKLNVQTAINTSRNANTREKQGQRAPDQDVFVAPRVRAYRTAFIWSGVAFLVIGVAFWIWKRRA